MVFRSKSTSPTSTFPSPASHSSLLTPIMTSDEVDTSVRSARSTPNRHSIDLPRTQTVSKGGCWTCRLRRKKCDEQREGDSCKTCLRLTIECLGWGPKRPDWMRDKQAVEAYKANIKAKLTRAGLIRGQPRSALVQATNVGNTMITATSQSRSAQQFSRKSVADIRQSTSSNILNAFESEMSFVEASHSHPHSMTILPALPGGSNPSFHHFNDPSLNILDLHQQYYSYSPQTMTPLSNTIPLVVDNYNFDFSHCGVVDQNEYGFDLRPPSPQVSVFEDIYYYISHVRKIQFAFAGNAFTNITYLSILEDIHGPVANAICALSSLHANQIRIEQGLESLSRDAKGTQATYFHDEAVFQLTSAKQQHGRYRESDAIAALHLVSYSQMSGGNGDWQSVFTVTCEWVAQTGLFLEESNARRVFDGLSSTGQLIVKMVLWIDIFSTLTSDRPPRYLNLCRKLLGDQQSEFWTRAGSLRMDLLTGCPDEAMLCIAETSALAHWKASNKKNGTLSYRELIRRGDALEQRMRQHQSDIVDEVDVEMAPLHPDLLASAVADSVNDGPSEGTRRIIASIFRETALLYLHTVLSESQPGVPEITTAVNAIFSQLNTLAPSELDRGMMFPIGLAGALTDDSIMRAFFKRRLTLRNENIGSILPCRVLMESIWQQRDCDGPPVALCETAQKRNLNFLFF